MHHSRTKIAFRINTLCVHKSWFKFFLVSPNLDFHRPPLAVHVSASLCPMWCRFGETMAKQPFRQTPSPQLGIVFQKTTQLHYWGPVNCWHLQCSACEPTHQGTHLQPQERPYAHLPRGHLCQQRILRHVQKRGTPPLPTWKTAQIYFNSCRSVLFRITFCVPPPPKILFYFWKKSHFKFF